MKQTVKKKIRKWKWIRKGLKAGTFLSVLAGIGCSGAAFVLAGIITGGKRQTLKEARKWQDEHYDTSWFDSLETDQYTVRSFDGYLLHVCLCRRKGFSRKDRFVILTHGYTDNRFGTLKYMPIYLDQGYSCIIWDLRGHGENAPAPCTYSVRESRDLLHLIQDTRKRYGEEIELGLHGESLGSAATIAALEYTQDVAFAVADCGFSDIMNVLERSFSHNHIPQFLLKAASLASGLRYGCRFSEMRPVDALSDNHVPLLFIHGARDRLILPDNSLRMAKATAGPSQVHLIPGAKHADSVLTDRKGYTAIVHSFLNELHQNTV